MAELREVGYRVNGVTILTDVSATFRPGKFNVILGPNGAGKSTALKIATGLLAPTSGAVYYGGRPLSSFDGSDLARVRAVLSQHVELAFSLTVEDVVMMGRYPHYGRAPTVRDGEIVESAIALVGMTEKREQPYPTLSGGEKQKVQLARVLAQIWTDERGGSGKHLFLDEPTSSLDVHYELHILDIARGLLKNGCTVVAVMHDINVALRYGDAFFLMHEGRVALATEDPRDLSREILERVFRVKAHHIAESGPGGAGAWRFTL